MLRPLHRGLLSASLLLLTLAGCGTPLQSLANLPSNSPFDGNTLPPTPSIPASAPVLAPNEAGLRIYVNDPIAPASSYVLATNRNHTADDFPNGQAKLDKLLELRPTWGQGRYMYRIGHGPTDGRKDYSYMTGYHFEQEWDKNGPYPYDDLRNALRDADTLHAEQLHVINFGTGTPEEAASYVSYLNNPDDPNRKAHPFPVQNARYFELGNEISWSMVRGHNKYAATARQYAQRAEQFAKAMRQASPIPIKIGAVASTNSNWQGDGWSGGASTVKSILQTMGNDVDFLIYHGYPSWPMKKDGDLMTLMAQNAWNDQILRKEIEPAIQKYETHPVQIANTEFFTELYSDPTTARGMFGAVYSADTITLAFNHDMLLANQFCFDHGNSADSSFFIDDDPNKVTPIFQLQKLLAHHWGDDILRTAGQNLPTRHVDGAAASIDMPVLAFTAAKGRNGTIYVLVTNRTNDQDVQAHLALGFTPKSAIAYTLGGPNGWKSTPEDVKVTTTQPDLEQPMDFKAASVTLLEIKP